MKYIECPVETAVRQQLLRDVDLQFTSGLPKTTTTLRGIRKALEVGRHSFTHFAHTSYNCETDKYADS